MKKNVSQELSEEMDYAVRIMKKKNPEKRKWDISWFRHDFCSRYCSFVSDWRAVIPYLHSHKFGR